MTALIDRLAAHVHLSALADAFAGDIRYNAALKSLKEDLSEREVLWEKSRDFLGTRFIAFQISDDSWFTVAIELEVDPLRTEEPDRIRLDHETRRGPRSEAWGSLFWEHRQNVMARRRDRRKRVRHLAARGLPIPTWELRYLD